MIDAHLRNSTGHRTVRKARSLLLTSGLVRYEAVFHNYGTIPAGCASGGGGCWYWLVRVYSLRHYSAPRPTISLSRIILTLSTHGDFIVLPNWYIRPLAPRYSIPLSLIILTLSQPVNAILIMPSTRLDKYQFLSHWFDSTRVQPGRKGNKTCEVRILQSSSMVGGWSTHSVTPPSFVVVSLCSFKI